eukprot:619830-Ditylum_brightwellii.AAC.1
MTVAAATRKTSCLLPQPPPQGQKFRLPVATHALTLFAPSLLPCLPHHLLHRYDAPDTSLTCGDNVTCCDFACAIDPLRWWCHFLVLGPGEWHQCLATA